MCQALAYKNEKKKKSLNVQYITFINLSAPDYSSDLESNKAPYF